MKVCPGTTDLISLTRKYRTVLVGVGRTEKENKMNIYSYLPLYISILSHVNPKQRLCQYILTKVKNPLDPPEHFFLAETVGLAITGLPGAIVAHLYPIH